MTFGGENSTGLLFTMREQIPFMSQYSTPDEIVKVGTTIRCHTKSFDVYFMSCILISLHKEQFILSENNTKLLFNARKGLFHLMMSVEISYTDIS